MLRGSRTPPALREDLLENLRRYREPRAESGLLWGPANLTRLTEALGRIGASDTIAASQRVRIAQTLSARGAEPPTLEALAGILVRADPSPELDRLGAAVLLKFLKLLESEEALSVEDREVYIRLLGRICLRGRFETRTGTVDRLLERAIDTLAQGLAQGIPGCLQRLTTLRDARRLPEKHQKRLEAELSRFTSLAVRPTS